MAVESKRGCGYRKIGGLYLVSGRFAIGCDRLPIELSVCPCCGGGIKQARGWTWIQPTELFMGNHGPGCRCSGVCPACNPVVMFGTDKAGLLWIGRQHYPTVSDFVKEGADMGISRRINAIPREFELGKTWVFLAHPAAIQRVDANGEGELFEKEMKDFPGIFTAFKPSRIERLVKQSEYDVYNRILDNLSAFADQPETERNEVVDAYLNGLHPVDKEIWDRLHSDVSRGITLIPVPDNDKDHQ